MKKNVSERKSSTAFVNSSTNSGPQQFYKWKQNTVTMIGRALAAQQAMGFFPHTLGKRFEQPRLTHPGFACQ
jgi:hypothetical protein